MFRILWCVLQKHSQNIQKRSRNAKSGVSSMVFHVPFFSFRPPFFCFSPFAAFCARSAFAQKSKDFVVYFFTALIKHKIRIKCEKCIVSVSYFVVCFVKTFAKYPQNGKYKKCIAGLMNLISRLFTSFCSQWMKKLNVNLYIITQKFIPLASCRTTYLITRLLT